MIVKCRKLEDKSRLIVKICKNTIKFKVYVTANHQYLQYCSKVTHAKFDEIRSLFTFESSNEI